MREASEPFFQYIPDLQWNVVNSHMSLPPSARHLLHSQRNKILASPIAENGVNIEDALEIVLSLLDVSKDEFDMRLPLISYGLDSIGAAKVAAALRPYASVSQMQLLDGITWNQLVERVHKIDVISGERLSPPTNPLESALEIILTSLSISEADFSANVPLVAYGLDSLGASKLARALRPFVSVTQMQLLGQITWADLQIQINALLGQESQQIDVTSALTPATSLPPNTDSDSIVEFFSGPGVPLIVFPGVTGSINPVLPLQAHLTTPLWVIQVTDITPLTSLSALTSFLYKKIKVKRPRGPYRFACYSGSSIIGVALAKNFEQQGDRVTQLAFIDHFPALWTCGAYDFTGVRRERGYALIPDTVVGQGIDAVAHLLHRDPLVHSSVLTDEMMTIRQGRPSSSKQAHLFVKTITAIVKLIYGFLTEFQPTDMGDLTNLAFAEPFMRWLTSVEAPFTLFIAANGVKHTLDPQIQGEWSDLGAGKSSKHVDVHIIDAGHYGIFDDKTFAHMLQQRDDKKNSGPR